MKKTLLSILAAAGVIASGAAPADSSLVEVYGTLNVDLENVQAKSATVPVPAGIGQLGSAGAGAAAPSRNRVTSNSSNIGFRGKEDLGMGWNAIFQVESGLSIDSASNITTTVNNPGAANPTTATNTQSSGFWATRNSNIGLSSNRFGTVFYGNWDTPYKALTNIATFDPFYGTGIASDNAVIGTPGFGVATTTAGGRAAVLGGPAVSGDASFDRRQGNSVQYWTPQFFGGLSARFDYSANEQRSPENGVTANINPTIYSASLRYEYGPFVAAYAFEQHRDYFGLASLGGTVASVTNKTARDNGNKVTLSYKFFGTTTANMAWERLSYNNSDTVTGNLINYRRDLIYVSLLHQMGPHTFRLGFGDARQGSCVRGGATACSTNGLDARHYAAGYSYSFSKRTDLYAFWTIVNNGSFATYQLANGAGIGAAQSAGTGAGGGAGGGSRNQGFGLGMRHAF